MTNIYRIDVLLTPPAALALKDAAPPEGVRLTIPPIILRRDMSEAWATAIFTVAASIPAATAATLIATFLTDKLKPKRTAVITINRQEVCFEHGEISRVIEETIRVEHKIDT